jgi:class 3 adenylate cyclase
MSWNYHTSLNEIQQHVTRMTSKPIRISPLDEDLDRTALSEFQCKRVYGAHAYVSIPAFARLASRVYDTEGVESYQELTHAIHLYQQEVFRIVRLFDGYQVHFQGPKLHAILYKPLGDGTAIAIRAILLQLVLNDFLHQVFHRVFPRYQTLALASGTDLGKTIATANGQRNDRELLFIGSPANYAAKIINNSDEMPRLTQNIYRVLPKDLRDLCILVKDKETVPIDVYRLLPIDSSMFEHLLRRYNIAWKPDISTRILTQAKQDISPASIAHRSEHTLIDLDELSIHNNRRVLAASLFADVSGFTKYVERHEHTNTQDAAMYVLHAIRREMSRVVRADYGGLRIQFQGDRVQALFHLPRGNERAIAMQAVGTAIGLQSSMEITLRACLPELAASLHLAIGVDIGATLVSKLGIREHRDPICLGRAVERAAMLEELCSARQIGISHRVYKALPQDKRHVFTYDKEKQCYIGTDLIYREKNVEPLHTRADSGYSLNEREDSP